MNQTTTPSTEQYQDRCRSETSRMPYKKFILQKTVNSLNMSTQNQKITKQSQRKKATKQTLLAPQRQECTKQRHSVHGSPGP